MALIDYVEAKMVEAGHAPDYGILRLTDDGLGNITVAYPSDYTPQQVTAANAFVAALDKSPATVAAWDLAQAKTLTISLFLNDKSPMALTFRAFAEVVRTRVNEVSGNVCPKRGPEVQFVWDPASMANATGVTSPVQAYPGAQVGDLVEVSPPVNPAGVIVAGFVPAANQVQVRLQNGTGATVNPPSGTWAVRVRAPGTMAPASTQDLLNAVTNAIQVG